MQNESLAMPMMFTAGICGMMGVVFPWLALLFNRTVAAMSAGGFALAATMAFLISNIYMPGHFNIRVDLLILPPLLLVVWLQCLALSIWALYRRGRRATSIVESELDE